MAFNAANLTRCSPLNVTGPALYTYYTSVDNAATVSGANYFTPFADSYSQNYFPFFFNVGDTIQCTCSDVNVNLDVTSITPVTVAEQSVDVVVGPNSVNTAAIQANAVTAAKIANGTITTTQISGAAGITGAQLAAGANIAGTQLAAAAGITGGQIANTTLTGGNLVNGTITATQLATSVPQNIRFQILSANFKTAYTAGIQVIAAAGANTLLIVDSVTYSFNYVTAAYTGGGVMQLQYSTAAPLNAAGIAATTGVSAATLTGLSATGYITDTGVLAINGAAGLVNAGLWFTVATANFAAGSGNLICNIKYRVITV